MSSEYGTREVVDLIVELGLVDSAVAAESLAPYELDQPLSYFGRTVPRAVCGLLGELGIRYTLDYKTFRGIEDADDEERSAWYRDELEAIAACARGAVTITEVRLVEGDEDEWDLRFDWNGDTHVWSVCPGDAEEALEAALTFATYLPGMTAHPVGVFCAVDPPDEDYSGEAVFGDPDALNALGARFGLEFIGPRFRAPEAGSETGPSPVG
ncbi:hypothetical protein [Nocardia sp. NBC_00416]|uniref:hypothetical protein n=1 Tax=Nocardia sp. NBC_00416 TaxID=2975991 RepID=UPI002E1A4D92